jgi:hypothetical protein
MTGMVSLTDGRELPVTGRAAAGEAGLYRAEVTGSDSKAVAGWILAADGQQRGGIDGEGSFTKLSEIRCWTLPTDLQPPGTGHRAHRQSWDHPDPEPVIPARVDKPEENTMAAEWLDGYLDGWNSHDGGQVAAFMTVDLTYPTSIPER